MTSSWFFIRQIILPVVWYVCDTVSLIIEREHGLNVFEEHVLHLSQLKANDFSEEIFKGFEVLLTFWRRNYFFNFSTPCI